MDKWGGGGSEYQDSPSKSFCLRVPKTFVEEPLCAVFQKVSKSEKVYGSEARRRVSSFSVENFCLTVPKIFVEEPFCAAFQKISGSENVFGSEGRRRVSSFSVENFLSHSAERICRRGGGGGSIKDFRRKIFVSVPKSSYKSPSVFHYFRVTKSFML